MKDICLKILWQNAQKKGHKKSDENENSKQKHEKFEDCSDEDCEICGDDLPEEPIWPLESRPG